MNVALEDVVFWLKAILFVHTLRLLLTRLIKRTILPTDLQNIRWDNCDNLASFYVK